MCFSYSSTFTSIQKIAGPIRLTNGYINHKHNETKVILTSYYSDSKIWNVISLLSCVILYNSVKYEIVGFFSKCKYKKNFNWLCLHVWFLSCLHSPNTHVYVPFWLKWKGQQFWVIYVRDCSLATLTKCWLLLTTYLPGWHWWRNSYIVVKYVSGKILIFPVPPHSLRCL